VHEVDVIFFFISLLYLFFISAIALRYSSSSSRRRRRRRGFLSSDDGVNKCFPLSMKEEEATLSRTTTTKGERESAWEEVPALSLARSLARERERESAFLTEKVSPFVFPHQTWAKIQDKFFLELPYKKALNMMTYTSASTRS